jgi:hypothetical protein
MELDDFVNAAGAVPIKIRVIDHAERARLAIGEELVAELTASRGVGLPDHDYRFEASMTLEDGRVLTATFGRPDRLSAEQMVQHFEERKRTSG